ncbi:MAG: hypothetical protein HRT87_03360 [Legionellales bacterium]|nr:hypothetical protein [Legionellales bacterium]
MTRRQQEAKKLKQLYNPDLGALYKEFMLIRGFPRDYVHIDMGLEGDDTNTTKSKQDDNQAPEMRRYFSMVTKLIPQDTYNTQVAPYNKFTRGGFTGLTWGDINALQMINYFQEHSIDELRDAPYNLREAQIIDLESTLRNTYDRLQKSKHFDKYGTLYKPKYLQNLGIDKVILKISDPSERFSINYNVENSATTNYTTKIEQEGMVSDDEQTNITQNRTTTQQRYTTPKHTTPKHTTLQSETIPTQTISSPISPNIVETIGSNLKVNKEPEPDVLFGYMREAHEKYMNDTKKSFFNKPSPERKKVMFDVENALIKIMIKEDPAPPVAFGGNSKNFSSNSSYNEKKISAMVEVLRLNKDAIDAHHKKTGFTAKFNKNSRSRLSKIYEQQIKKIEKYAQNNNISLDNGSDKLKEILPDYQQEVQKYTQNFTR